MRVLFDEQIFSNQRFGGISRYYTELVKKMGEKDEVTAKLVSLLCTNHYAKQVPRSCRVGIPFPILAGTETLRWHVNRQFSKQYVKFFKPDILHQTYYPNRIPRLNPGSKIVTTVHDMVHELFPENFIDSKKASELKLQSVRSADLVICVSENTRKDLIEITGIEKAKTTVIHHGVDHLKFLPLPANLPMGKPYLLYVGLRHTYKNFHRVLKAYASDKELMKDFNLVCFGGGSLIDSEKELIARLNIPGNNIVMTGGNDTVLCSLYQHAAAFLYPSIYEGFGLPPLEAMTQKCPVISSNVSSLPEVLGVAAEFFDPCDTDDLITAIGRVLNNPERSEELRDLGYTQAHKFKWGRCASETLESYKQLI